MQRREPPPIAAWALEHMTSGDRDEALVGDLLEGFQCGRSNGWFWRQACAACAVSWFESLRARASLLVFAVVWSMTAPGWNAVCLMVENSSQLGRLQPVFGPIWILPALFGWTILRSIFLWAGLLVFSVFHLSLGGSFDTAKFKRAFLLAPVIFAPAYFVMFVGVDLYWFSTFKYFQLQGSPLSQMVDLRLLANVIRIPYLLALTGALWRTVLRPGRATTASPHPSTVDLATDSQDFTRAAIFGSFATRHFFALTVGAGLMNAMIAGLLLCQLPNSHSPTLASLATRAALYVLAGVLAGAGGTYLYWKNPASPFSAREPLPFPHFVLICAGGWVWVPAMVILLEQKSPASALVAAIGAFVFTSELRRALSSMQNPVSSVITASGQGGAGLFVESLYPAPSEAYGYVIALSLYAGVAAFFFRSYFTAAALFVLAASVFAWKKTVPQEQGSGRATEYKRAALQLGWITIFALLVTVWALLDGVAHRNRLAEADAGNTSRVGGSLDKNASQRLKFDTTTLGEAGYESVILWPYPPKRQIIPPIVAEKNLLVPGTKEPLTIRFNGSYWYLQPPHKDPGPTAHKASGTPLGYDIQSSNSIPLVMNAHQYLSAPIPIARCLEIAVDIENRDNTPGKVSLGVLLSDGASTKNSALYLGEQPIASTQPGHFAFKSESVFETLHFVVPTNSKLRRFNEITVLFLPDVEHALVAPKIAISQFNLFPR